MKILHLTDLHFGIDKGESRNKQREVILDALFNLNEIKDVDIVVITGDIAWQCRDDGYDLARKWFLLFKQKLKKDVKFIGCCGNHDVNQGEVMGMSYCSSEAESEKILNVEQLDFLERRFRKYIDFCSELEFEIFTIGSKKSYVVGSTIVNGLTFWNINTSWFAFKGSQVDQHHLWMGKHFYPLLERSSKMIIALMHHPKEWLNPNETQSADQLNRSLFEKISATASVCLCGHVHGPIQEPTKYDMNMYSFSAGATYAGEDYMNNISFFDIDVAKGKVERTPYISQDGDKWMAWPQMNKTYSCFTNTDYKLPLSIPQEISETTKLKFSLTSLGFNLINITTTDLAVNRKIIWPVVPRDNLTTIHLAQIALMRKLHMNFGWSIDVIISNCGSKPLNNKQLVSFKQKISKYLERLEVTDFSISSLNDYFRSQDELAAVTLENFISITSSVNLPTLKMIRDKKYSDDRKAKNEQDFVLDHILPLLQIAVVNSLAKKFFDSENRKAVVIAGNDEENQWSEAVRVIGQSYLGAILIPELSISDRENINQSATSREMKKVTECLSQRDLEQTMDFGNVSSWMYRMFVALDNSQETITSIGLFTRPNDGLSVWRNNDEFRQYVVKDKLIEMVWGAIEKGNITN